MLLCVYVCIYIIYIYIIRQIITYKSWNKFLDLFVWIGDPLVQVVWEAIPKENAF